MLQKDLEYWQIDELILEPCCALKYYPEIELCVKEQKGEQEAKVIHGCVVFYLSGKHKRKQYTGLTFISQRWDVIFTLQQAGKEKGQRKSYFHIFCGDDLIYFCSNRIEIQSKNVKFIKLWTTAGVCPCYSSNFTLMSSSKETTLIKIINSFGSKSIIACQLLLPLADLFY